MATTVAALLEAQLLSDSTLDFIKRCFVIPEVKHCMPKHSLSQSQAICHLCFWAQDQYVAVYVY